MPKHGESRDHHYEDDHGNRVHVLCAFACQSVQERYCVGCDKWVKAEGVVGELRFMAEHGDHGDPK